MCYRWVLAEVKVTAEIAVVADDLWQDVGVTGVTELGFVRKLSDVNETQEVSFQLIHLVDYVGIQGKDLNRQKMELLVNQLQILLNCAVRGKS